jgi:hypothetical protein
VFSPAKLSALNFNPGGLRLQGTEVMLGTILGTGVGRTLVKMYPIPTLFSHIYWHRTRLLSGKNANYRSISNLPDLRPNIFTALILLSILPQTDM